MMEVPGTPYNHRLVDKLADSVLRTTLEESIYLLSEAVQYELQSIWDHCSLKCLKIVISGPNVADVIFRAVKLSTNLFPSHDDDKQNEEDFAQELFQSKHMLHWDPVFNWQILINKFVIFILFHVLTGHTNEYEWKGFYLFLFSWRQARNRTCRFKIISRISGC